MEITAARSDARLGSVVILYFCSLQNGIRVAHQQQSRKLCLFRCREMQLSSWSKRHFKWLHKSSGDGAENWSWQVNQSTVSLPSLPKRDVVYLPGAVGSGAVTSESAILTMPKYPERAFFLFPGWNNHSEGPAFPSVNSYFQGLVHLMYLYTHTLKLSKNKHLVHSAPCPVLCSFQKQNFRNAAILHCSEGNLLLFLAKVRMKLLWKIALI